MNVLKINLKHIRGIKNLNIELPLEPGLYALTGKNGSGKSTLMAAIGGKFYWDILERFFHNSAEPKSEIEYELNEKKTRLKFNKKNGWQWDDTNGGVRLHGFYEGSIIHGNRFRDTNYAALFNAAGIKKENLTPADQFVSENLGKILHSQPNHYQNLYRLKRSEAERQFKFRGSPYFWIDTNLKIISQMSLSTGENLLISALHSINYQFFIRRGDHNDEYLILLDEIELALHPSALLRLLTFLKDLAFTKKIAIYFSTHSLELIRNISPSNIFFLEKHLDRTVEIINPCYPAYASRSLYIHDRYDIIIFCEDALSKKIIEWILKEEDLLQSKLIHVLPCGGWEEVLGLHHETIQSNLIGGNCQLLSALDGDIEDHFNSQYLEKGKHRNLNVTFLSIPSLEKLLRKKLVIDVDHKFFRHFGDTFFRQRSLNEVVHDYSTHENFSKDYTGKQLWKLLKKELSEIGTPEVEFISLVTNYVVKNEDMSLISKKLRRALTP